ncbi:hypothetical protein EUTSA_v10009332mg [Eutrema salsugineum]|uniref:Uncharacterized protein n=1 Tax=Eutrema salsugineum TaxID=72664 RepID=V4MWF4_EUTSA|nr:hypothetical protein EUTSA_v10009332mg [Eutrema salsugineum]
MNPATADESQRRHQPWWKSKYVIYDIVMHILLIAFIVATFLYVRLHKIPIAANKTHMIKILGFYCYTAILGAISWVILLKNKPELHFRGGTMDRVSHIIGFVFLIVLFYSISPVFAFCFTIPFSWWFLSVLIHTLYVILCT